MNGVIFISKTSASRHAPCINVRLDSCDRGVMRWSFACHGSDPTETCGGQSGTNFSPSNSVLHRHPHPTSFPYLCFINLYPANVENMVSSYQC